MINLSKFSLFSSALASPFLISHKKKQFSNQTECEEKGSKEAADLDKIFAQDGSMPPDPEEIQAMIAKMKG